MKREYSRNAEIVGFLGGANVPINPKSTFNAEVASQPWYFRFQLSAAGSSETVY